MSKLIVYINGGYVALQRESLDFLTPGQQRLNGVFETMRVDEGEVHDLDLHLKRLARGLKILKVKQGLTQAGFKRIVAKVIALNASIKLGRLRICVYQGKQELHQAVMLLPYQSLPLAKYRQGLKACVIKTQRKATARTADVKSLDYALFAKAYAQAKAKGYDDAILLNNKGHVFESTRANIFVVYNNQWYTPPLSSGCLNGITRAELIRVLKRLGIPVTEAPVTLAILKKATHVYLTNALIGMIKIDCLLAPGGLSRYN